MCWGLYPDWNTNNMGVIEMNLIDPIHTFLNYGHTTSLTYHLQYYTLHLWANINYNEIIQHMAGNSILYHDKKGPVSDTHLDEAHSQLKPLSTKLILYPDCLYQHVIYIYHVSQIRLHYLLFFLWWLQSVKYDIHDCVFPLKLDKSLWITTQQLSFLSDVYLHGKQVHLLAFIYYLTWHFLL